MPLSTIPVINPATNQEIARFEPTPPDQVTHMIQSVHQRYLDWKKTSLEERRQLCQRLGEVLRKNKEAYAQLMTEEMGKVLSEARAEVDKCARLADYYAQEAPRFLALEPIATEAQKSYVAFRPLGVVLAVMPWNFPFWQVLRFAIPAILAGNTALLKHASNVPGCSQTLEAIFLEAGFPESTFRSLLIKGSEVAQVIGHPLVKAVTLTGSTPAGKAVAQKAGEMLQNCFFEHFS
ncbi:MAG: aldehyde dehydrogenase family protein, partial [Bacteroidota bacterium]